MPPKVMRASVVPWVSGRTLKAGAPGPGRDLRVSGACPRPLGRPERQSHVPGLVQGCSFRPPPTRQ